MQISFLLISIALFFLITADHFIPLIKGGHTIINNIVPACSHCNSSKQAKMPQEWCSKEQLRCVLDIMATYS